MNKEKEKSINNGKFERARLTQEACGGKEALVTYSQHKRTPLRAGMLFFAAVAMATILSACRKGDAPAGTPPAEVSAAQVVQHLGVPVDGDVRLRGGGDLAVIAGDPQLDGLSPGRTEPADHGAQVLFPQQSLYEMM